ncbi:hypothetical protein [Flavobacterium hercynium]|uniref:Uncharacterized protein n=2 Tax=Flavobacterium hercynium TaxID=387094 RepID=A0A226H3B6_9FLAO|nr:hypothetical protein [Flavobacterium hercynium]OXA88723.1 hypothetical protein B0A66_15065 [Flavobacterium hercynium]
MKQVARILLFIFIAFLSTPTIVTVMKESNDTSVFFSFAEEEHSHKELKAAVYPAIFQHEIVMPVCIKKETIVSQNTVKLDSISATIFAPPPNLS